MKGEEEGAENSEENFFERERKRCSRIFDVSGHKIILPSINVKYLVKVT